MKQSFKLTESVGGFREGEILDVTARFGDWHQYELELEPRSTARSTSSKVVVTESTAGFSEAEILDPTARFGDWHEYDLKFTPVSGSTDITAGGIVELTAEELGQVADPVA
jgi:pyruvate-formate lyase-activating enzyme